MVQPIKSGCGKTTSPSGVILQTRVQIIYIPSLTRVFLSVIGDEDNVAERAGELVTVNKAAKSIKLPLLKY